DVKPRLTVFPTISTHFPFYQVPPYQPDWKQLLSDKPFELNEAKKAQNEQVSWGYMWPDYVRTINYCHKWLAGYFENTQQRGGLYILIGDHQPTGNIVGPEATWDVPVFVISDDESLLERFKELGFTAGLDPARRQSMGGLHDLTGLMLKALGG
ncbi:MAG: hypothetical protein R3194_13285, partial [Limnobacter sp.]|nr:hypothetical protein [Limnobacter sp.]